MSPTNHAQQKEQSDKLLAAARDAAKERNNYNSEETRAKLSRDIAERFDGRAPYPWQLDVGEAVSLGLDAILVARTGAGKTLPFVIPVLLGGKVIILSPLNALQDDQVQRFRQMGIKAVAVNGKTWSKKLNEQLEKGDFDVVLTSPEMCFKHEGFRALFSKKEFTKGMSGIIIDEGHCIPGWKDKFRAAYGDIATLRSLLPTGIPVFATSATLTEESIAIVARVLEIDLSKAYILNLGNDRPNIYYSIEEVSSQEDFEALLNRFRNVTTANQLKKTFVFSNKIKLTQQMCTQIRSVLPEHLRDKVAYYHSLRSERSKKKVLRKFRTGEILVLVSTEAAGMGTDISDVSQVIQQGVTSDLSTWMQRAGRAGRDTRIHAEAVLLVEKSVFKLQKAQDKGGGIGERTGGVEPDEELPNEEAEDVGEVANDEEEEEPDGDLEYKKKVEPGLRDWIGTEDCRRDAADCYFSNPPDRSPPTGRCCDNCERRKITNTAPNEEESNTPGELLDRPQTPIQQERERGVIDDTPSKTRNRNGKRQMRQKGPAKRTLQWLADAREVADDWRFELKKREYPASVLSSQMLLPDGVLKKVTANARIRTVDEIESELDVPWMFARKHGAELLSKLHTLDESRSKAHEAKILKAREERKLATVERKAKEKLERERGKIRKQIAEASRKQIMFPFMGTPPPASPRPLDGSSVFNSTFAASPSVQQSSVLATASFYRSFFSSPAYRSPSFYSPPPVVPQPPMLYPRIPVPPNAHPQLASQYPFSTPLRTQSNNSTGATPGGQESDEDDPVNGESGSLDSNIK